MNTLALTFALLTPIGASLVQDLGHDAFHQREIATRSLGALGPLGYPHLEAALNHEDAEVRARARGLLRDAWLRRASPLVMPTTYDLLPYLDALPHDYPERGGVRDLVLAGERPADVRKLLDQMVAVERSWRQTGTPAP